MSHGNEISNEDSHKEKAYFANRGVKYYERVNVLVRRSNKKDNAFSFAIGFVKSAAIDGLPKTESVILKEEDFVLLTNKGMFCSNPYEENIGDKSQAIQEAFFISYYIDSDRNKVIFESFSNDMSFEKDCPKWQNFHPTFVTGADTQISCYSTDYKFVSN